MTFDVCLLTFPPVTRSAPGRVNSQETAFGEIDRDWYRELGIAEVICRTHPIFSDHCRMTINSKLINGGFRWNPVLGLASNQGSILGFVDDVSRKRRCNSRNCSRSSNFWSRDSGPSFGTNLRRARSVSMNLDD